MAGMMKSPTPQINVKEPEPIRLPSPDDPDLEAARRKKMQETLLQRQGRKSTELTGNGPAYSRTTLG